MVVYHFLVTIWKDGAVVITVNGSVESDQITSSNDYNKLVSHISEFQAKKHSCEIESVLVENLSRL